MRDFSQAHERAGFDKVLVGYTSTAAEGFVIAGYAAAHTERLAYLIAHRPGFVAPTLAARKAATFDHVSGGRLALHIITGGSDADQAKDGDWTDHEARYRRSAEYMSLLRRTWIEPAPFDHEGRSEEHTSELQSLTNLVCRLLLEKKNESRGKTRRS